MPAPKASAKTRRSRSGFATLTPDAISLPLSRSRRARRCGALGWRTTTLRRDADWRQILKPALRLHKPLDLWRQCPRIEVVDDKDHHGQPALELVELGQQAKPFLVFELLEDLLDQPLGLRALEMSPVRALGRPIAIADELDDRTDRIEQA